MRSGTRAFAAIAFLLVIGLQPGTVIAQGASSMNADDAAQRQTLAQQIIDISYPEEVRFDLFNETGKQLEAQILESLRTTMLADAPPEALEVLQAWQKDMANEQQVILRQNIPAIMEAWINAYASTFSIEELQDILAFVQTPSGLRFMNSQQSVLQEPSFVAANQAYMGEIMTLTQKRLPDLLEALVATREETGQRSGAK